MRTFRTFSTHKGISISPPRSIVSGGKLPIARENEMGGTLLSMSKLCPSVLPPSPPLSLRGLGRLSQLCRLRHKVLFQTSFLIGKIKDKMYQPPKKFSRSAPLFSPSSSSSSSSAALKEVPIKNRKRQQLPCLTPYASPIAVLSCPLLDLKCGAVIPALSDTKPWSEALYRNNLYVLSQAAT